MNLHHGQLVTLADVPNVYFIILGFRQENDGEYMAVLVDHAQPKEAFHALASMCLPVVVN